MNPETEFPEVINLKRNEMLVYRACIFRGQERFSVSLNIVITEQTRKTVVDYLKMEHKADEVYLTKISKM